MAGSLASSRVCLKVRSCRMKSLQISPLVLVIPSGKVPVKSMTYSSTRPVATNSMVRVASLSPSYLVAPMSKVATPV